MSASSKVATASKTVATTAKKIKVSFPKPATMAQWAADELQFMGTNITIPKITALVGWEKLEATFRPYNKNALLSQGGGNQFNPLDIESYHNDYPTFGKSPVAFVQTLAQGLSLTTKQFQEPQDESIYQALTSKSPSLSDITNAIGRANWTGEGTASNVAYGQEIGEDAPSGANLMTLGLTNPNGTILIPTPVDLNNVVDKAYKAAGKTTKKAVTKAVGGTTKAVMTGLEDAVTSSTAIRVLLVIVGLVIGFIALKELTESDHGPGQTISVPVSNAYQKGKSHAKSAATAAAS